MGVMWRDSARHAHTVPFSVRASPRQLTVTAFWPMFHLLKNVSHVTQ